MCMFVECGACHLTSARGLDGLQTLRATDFISKGCPSFSGNVNCPIHCQI